MDAFVCKVADSEEMERKWEDNIRRNLGDSDWLTWKKEALEQAKKGQSLPYYGILNGEIVTEATALLDPDVIPNGAGLADERTAHLTGFRTVEERRGEGWFSRLFRFLLDDLAARGYERVTIAVEPSEVKRMMLYFRYGFTEYIKTGVEVFPKGGQIVVLYYARQLRAQDTQN